MFLPSKNKVFTYLLTYKLAYFIVPEANLVTLLTFERVHFAKFHFHHGVFPRNTWLGTDILFINWSYIARSLVKKINTQLAFVYYPNGNEMDQMVRNDIVCNCPGVIAYRSLELLFGMHTFHFNCFFEDFICIFTQIRCLSKVLLTIMTWP